MRKEFQVHKLNEEGIKKAVVLAELYHTLAETVQSEIREGSPELTIAFRKLEESCFYAKKAMAQVAANQIPGS